MQDLLHNNSKGTTHSSKGGNPIRGERSSYSCGTRLTRIDFPCFSSHDVKQWLIQCDTLFSIDSTPEEFKVRLAVVHFEGRALQWHSSYVKSVGLQNLPPSSEYKRILIERFSKVCDDPMAELMQLRQKGSIVEYHEAFNAIVARLD